MITNRFLNRMSRWYVYQLCSLESNKLESPPGLAIIVSVLLYKHSEYWYFALKRIKRTEISYIIGCSVSY
jgi:hypothetical protein